MNQALHVRVEGEQLVISIGIKRLANAASHVPYIRECELPIWSIPDSHVFAKQMELVLQSPQNDFGETLVVKMLDDAAMEIFKEERS